MNEQSIIRMDLGESAVAKKEEMEEDAGGANGAWDSDSGLA